MTLEYVKIRKGKPSDTQLIVDTWVKTYRQRLTSPELDEATISRYSDLIPVLIERSHVIVACQKEDEDEIIGWACVENAKHYDIVHYIYVRYPHRKKGIARMMVAPYVRDRVYVSHARKGWHRYWCRQHEWAEATDLLLYRALERSIGPLTGGKNG